VSRRVAFLLGRGIAHSLSPAMHNAALADRGLDADYQLLDVTPRRLAAAVARLRRLDCLGANVTMPYKRMVVAHADGVSEAVRRCGAGNLLVSRDGRLQLDNTDVVAIRAALDRRARHLGRGPVAVLGSGGAAAGVLEALGELATPEVLLLARRPAAAAALARRFRDRLGGRITVLSIDAGAARVAECSVLVNATPIGMAPGDPSPISYDLLHPDLLVYDLVYRPGGPTALHQRAAERGCGVTCGLSHLLAQAGPSFELLTGLAAPWEVMRSALATAAGRQPVGWGADPAPSGAGSAHLD